MLPVLVTALAAAGLLGTAGALAGIQAPPSNRAPEAVRPFPPGLSGTLVFESDVSGRPAIYTLTLADGIVRPLTGGPSFTSATPRWSPDGRRVVFASNRAHYEGAAPETGTPDLDLWVVNADGSGLSRLTTDPANESDPAWTPSGDGVVYSSDRDSRGDLYRLVLASGAVTRLTHHYVGRAIMPAPSSDGARVAFAAQTLRVGAFWDFQVHVLNASGAAQPLEATAGSCWPNWSPDGTRMAHVRLPKNAPSALELRDGPRLASTKVLTAGNLWSYYPDWSPDGMRLAFAVSPEHHEGENWDLAVVEIQTGAWTRLTQGAGNDRLPDWKK